MLRNLLFFLAVLLLCFSCKQDKEHPQASLVKDLANKEIAHATDESSNQDITQDEVDAPLAAPASMEAMERQEPKKSNVKPSTTVQKEVPKKRPTIAEQQEAARRIQNENQSNEANAERAVFQKVVSTKKTETKAEVVERPKPQQTEKVEKPQAKQSTKTAYKKGVPILEFMEMEVALDTIVEGDIINHKFTFVNTGDAPLVVNSASATCGCTQPSYPFIPIEPSEEGHIAVRYNSVGKEGLQKPIITVSTNASKQPIQLNMEFFVEKKSKD